MLFVITEAVNIKKTYCGNNEFLGNRPNKYPHLHCGKNFITFSRGRFKHDNLQGRCNKVQQILANKDRLYGNAASPGEITSALQNYLNAGCPQFFLWNIINSIAKLNYKQ